MAIEAAIAQRVKELLEADGSGQRLERLATELDIKCASGEIGDVLERTLQSFFAGRNATEFEQLVEVRIAFETRIARSLIPSLKADVVAQSQINSLVQEMRALAELGVEHQEDFFELDLEFHATLARLAGEEDISSVITTLNTAENVRRAAIATSQARMKLICSQHEVIIDSILQATHADRESVDRAVRVHVITTADACRTSKGAVEDNGLTSRRPETTDEIVDDLTNRVRRVRGEVVDELQLAIREEIEEIASAYSKCEQIPLGKCDRAVEQLVLQFLNPDTYISFSWRESGDRVFADSVFCSSDWGKMSEWRRSIKDTQQDMLLVNIDSDHALMHS